MSQEKKGQAYKPLGDMVARARGVGGGRFVTVEDYDELRQQLADLSHERDGLRADARRYEYLRSISAAPEDYAELDAKIDAELSEVQS